MYYVRGGFFAVYYMLDFIIIVHVFFFDARHVYLRVYRAPQSRRPRPGDVLEISHQSHVTVDLTRDDCAAYEL